MNPILRMVWVWGGLAAATFISLAAFIRGGAPERWGAVVLMTSWFVSPLVDNHHGFRYGLLAADFLTMLGYLAVALSYRRLWAFAATASQLLAVLTHVIAHYSVGVGTWSYITLADIFGADVPMAVLALGILTSKPKPRGQGKV